MADHPIRGSDLRVVVPTLEPDEAFLGSLSLLAAAGGATPPTGRPPRSGWWVGLAAASVAAVLLVIAWLGGLGSSVTPDPTPAPASEPARPDASRTAAPTHPGRGIGPRGHTSTAGPGAPSSGTGAIPGTDRSARSLSRAVGPEATGDRASSDGRSPYRSGERGHGPDEHAGDHPDAHASQKSNSADPWGQKAHRSAGGRQSR